MKTNILRLDIFIIILILIIISSDLVNAQNFSRRTPIVVCVEKVGPSIVNISTEKIIKTHYFDDDIFFEFFNIYPRIYKTHSLGSGVIITSDGFIVTNYHVIKRASKITIILYNKKKYIAKLISYDKDNDIALLKIDVNYKLVPIKWGNSDEIMIGETAIALGNPFGLQNSVTTGVISAKNRALNIKGKVSFHDFIQTDAAINPGNSGGALLNINGELIGINTAIYSKGQGLGFAIPSNRVKKVIGELLNYRKIKDIWIGLDVKEKNKQVQIIKIFNYSPAKRTSLKVGDIIISINGKKIRSKFEFNKEIFIKEVGDIIHIKAYSPTTFKTKSVFIKIERIPISSKDILIWKRLGFILKESYYGLKVIKIRKGSSAERIGIKKGDILIALGDYKIENKEDVIMILEDVEKYDILPIILKRGNKRLIGSIIVE